MIYLVVIIIVVTLTWSIGKTKKAKNAMINEHQTI